MFLMLDVLRWENWGWLCGQWELKLFARSLAFPAAPTAIGKCGFPWSIPGLTFPLILPTSELINLNEGYGIVVLTTGTDVPIQVYSVCSRKKWSAFYVLFSLYSQTVAGHHASTASWALPEQLCCPELPNLPLFPSQRLPLPSSLIVLGQSVLICPLPAVVPFAFPKWWVPRCPSHSLLQVS